MYVAPTVRAKHSSQSAGFTLVEVLVSMSIFAVVVTMAVGTLVVLIDANAKAQAVQSVINNTSLVLDGMVRDIRTGFYYQCENNSGNLTFTNNTTNKNDCTGGASNFAFTETGGSLTGPNGSCGAGGCGSSRIGYRLSSVNGKGVIERKLGTAGAGNWSAVTAPDVDIKTLDFVVTGTANNANDVSPLVTIYIEGEVVDTGGNTTTFELQTTVTQQSLDL